MFAATVHVVGAELHRNQSPLLVLSLTRGRADSLPPHSPTSDVKAIDNDLHLVGVGGGG